MDSILATIWFFFMIICPGVTVAVVLWAARGCRGAVSILVRGAIVVTVLTLALGPIFTDYGPMPWWFEHTKAMGGRIVHNWVFAYAFTVAIAFAIVGLIAAWRHRNDDDA